MSDPDPPAWEGLTNEQLTDLVVNKGVVIDGKYNKLNVPKGKMVVIIPDMFYSILPAKPRVNQYYEEVKMESEKWICSIIDADEKHSANISGCDFSYFMGICAPDAAKEEYRALCDWGNWVFPFDDRFDNGDLKNDPVNAQRLLDALMRSIRASQKLNVPKKQTVRPHDDMRFHQASDRFAKVFLGSLLKIVRDDGMLGAMRELLVDVCDSTLDQLIKNLIHTPLGIAQGNGNMAAIKEPLIKVHDSVWFRIVEVLIIPGNSPLRFENANSQYTLDIQRRFAESMEVYSSGVLQHMEDLFEGRQPTIEEFMEERRGGVGVLPVIALIEYAHKIHVPNHIYAHESMVELRRVTIDVVILQNDIVSFRKEESEGVVYNIINLLRKTGAGMTTQAAFDTAGTMLETCFADWRLAKGRVPVVESEVEIYAVGKYVAGLEATMAANLHWQFKSERYLGASKDLARCYRTITVNIDNGSHKRMVNYGCHPSVDFSDIEVYRGGESGPASGHGSACRAYNYGL